MPKLTVFAPCERVIVEGGSNTISLIALLQELTAGVPTQTIPDDAMVPLRWYVLTMWIREESDRSVKLEQSVTLEDPNGNVRIELRTMFEMTDPSQRNVGLINGFPMAKTGTYTLRLRLRRADEEKWNDITTYPIELKQVPAAQLTYP